MNYKNIEIKPCPFCGEDVELYKNNEKGYTVYEADCINCDTIFKQFDKTETEAIEHWNSRPIEDALQEENIKLRAVVNFYADRKKYMTIIKGDNGEDENFMLRECGRYARNVLRQLERNRENEK